ncbi:MAG: prepilin-type N-terminal cleavage/methylation domain-containing protein [Trichlorobacter sp.]
MLNKMRNRQGFTLIELLIVVAIIGILAAVAIPQFSAYRQKGFNSAAVSDVKNAKTAEESLFADNQTYGSSQTGVTLDALVATAVGGALIVGPMSVAPSTAGGASGAALVGDRLVDNVVTKFGVGVATSNGVNMVASIDQIGVAAAAYVLSTKHNQGTRVFAAESASTAIMFVQNDTWAGTAMTAASAPATGVPNPATVDPTVISTLGGGGAPNANWAAL